MQHACAVVRVKLNPRAPSCTVLCAMRIILDAANMVGGRLYQPQMAAWYWLRVLSG